MVEEELTRRWEGFQLTDVENEVLELPIVVDKEAESRGKHCLLALILTEKGANKKAFKDTMSQIWKLDGWVSFKDMGDHMFLIEFQFQLDMEKVILGRPWFFDRSIVAIQLFDGSIPFNEIVFNYELFWVQIHNLPLNSMNQEVGGQVGAIIGKVLKVDVDEEGWGWGRCLRVQVEVDLYKPLVRGKRISARGSLLRLILSMRGCNPFVLNVVF
ncbi:uncharacterized protein LOC122281356 [Carya illinoinensis]|uniref:uncharacterized protein LOC122281356 n=1 Tax=Carya illinoinensis TaxID=32201 RepID=UPI001C71E02C|nr:uncharacterized protein LOC122281356 [Carya illinoinensis]